MKREIILGGLGLTMSSLKRDSKERQMLCC